MRWQLVSSGMDLEVEEGKKEGRKKARKERGGVRGCVLGGWYAERKTRRREGGDDLVGAELHWNFLSPRFERDFYG